MIWIQLRICARRLFVDCSFCIGRRDQQPGCLASVDPRSPVRRYRPVSFHYTKKLRHRESHSPKASYLLCPSVVAMVIGERTTPKLSGFGQPPFLLACASVVSGGFPHLLWAPAGSAAGRCCIQVSAACRSPSLGPGLVWAYFFSR